jgi:hypothetical protein
MDRTFEKSVLRSANGCRRMWQMVEATLTRQAGYDCPEAKHR